MQDTENNIVKVLNVYTGLMGISGETSGESQWRRDLGGNRLSPRLSRAAFTISLFASVSNIMPEHSASMSL